MKIIIHADDLGASKSITDGVIRCIDEGAVTSVSVISNGTAFEYAMQACRERPQIAIACHFNLVEGRPVAPARELDLLTDSHGYFCHGFLSLWNRYRFSTASTRRRLEHQVRVELAAQFSKLRNAVGEGVDISLDSHRHLHLIPFIFDAVVDVLRDSHVARVRLIQEPRGLAFSGLSYAPSGLAKNLLLNRLSRRGKRLLDEAGIAYPDYFVGVLFSGRMSLAVVDAALSRIPNGSGNEIVELLFHPGQARDGEQHLWLRYPAWGNYYFSGAHSLEAETLRSAKFKQYIQRYSDQSPMIDKRPRL